MEVQIHLTLVQRLIISEDVPPFPHKVSWHANGQLHLPHHNGSYTKQFLSFSSHDRFPPNLHHRQFELHASFQLHDMRPFKKHSSLRTWRRKTTGAAEHDHLSSSEIHRLQSDGTPVCGITLRHIKGKGWCIMPSRLKGEDRGIALADHPSPLKGGGWSAPRPGSFTTRKIQGTHCTRSRAGRGTNMDGSANLALKGVQTPDRPDTIPIRGLQLGGVNRQTAATAHN